MGPAGQASIGLIGAVVALITTVALKAKVSYHDVGNVKCTGGIKF